MEPVNVGILVFDEVEVLDFCGPFEVFSSALADGENDREERRLFRALIVAEQQRTILDAPERPADIVHGRDPARNSRAAIRTALTMF